MSFEPKKSTFRDQSSPDDLTRDQARLASRDCEYCNCDGLVTVYHPQHNTSKIGHGYNNERFPTVINARCRCEMGHWIRAHWPEEQNRVTPRLEDILESRSVWSLQDPTAPKKDSLTIRPGENFSQAIQRLIASKRPPAKPKPKTTAQIAAELAERKEREYTSMAENPGEHELPRS